MILDFKNACYHTHKKKRVQVEWKYKMVAIALKNFISYLGMLTLAYHVFIFPLKPLKLTSYPTFIDSLETYVLAFPNQSFPDVFSPLTPEQSRPNQCV